MALFSDEVRRDPYPVYEKLRAMAPVMPFGTAWVLLDHASVSRALREPEVFGSEVIPPTGKAPDWLIFTDPPRHGRQRALIAKAFTPKSVAQLEPQIRALARELIAGRTELELVGDLATPLPMLVIAAMLGIPAADRDRFVRWADGINGLSYSAVGGPLAQQMIAAYQRVRDDAEPYVAALVEERRRDPRDDLMTRLALAEIDGERLTGAELFGFFQLLLAAGTETTTNLIANAILCAAEHGVPRDLAPFIEEVVRYRTPAQVMFRQTKQAVELHSVTIPRDAFLLVAVGAANRDPAAFREPNRFDPTRDPNPHVGFGHGIHYCIGAALARLEARVVLEELFALGVPALASREPWTPRRALHVLGPTALPVVFRG
jgi:cytochrome P450